jgi:hypothetical protein
MLKGYALGFFTAALAVLLVAAIWIAAQPKQEPGLLWGDTVYTSKQEFDGYLKSKGLTYKTWLARNPGAAPWEPEEVTVGAITVRASTNTIQLLLAGLGWTLATFGALLLLRGQRPDSAWLAKGSVALFSTVLAGLLAGAIWFSTQSREEPGLRWGGSVYTSKEQFKGYLKAKGLNYETWVARNPGAAPWEPAAVRASTTKSGAAKGRSATTAAKPAEPGQARQIRPLLLGFGLVLAASCAFFLLLRRPRPAAARLAAEAAALFRGGLSRVGRIGRNPATANRVERGLTLAADAAGRVRGSAPVHGRRFAGAVQATSRRASNFVRDREVTGPQLAYGLVAVLSAVALELIIVSVLS